MFDIIIMCLHIPYNLERTVIPPEGITTLREQKAPN